MTKSQIAKSYLQSVKQLTNKRLNMIDRIERIEGILKNPHTSNYSNVKVINTQKTDKVQELLAVKIELENQLESITVQETLALCEIGEKIDKLPTSLYSRLLSLIYENDKSIHEAANILCYAIGTVYNMHEKALREFYNCYLKENQDSKQ